MKSIRPYLYVFYLPGQQCVHMSGVMLHEFLHAIKARHVGLLTENADDIRILSPGGTSADLLVDANASDIDLHTRRSLRGNSRFGGFR